MAWDPRVGPAELGSMRSYVSDAPYGLAPRLEPEPGAAAASERPALLLEDPWASGRTSGWVAGETAPERTAYLGSSAWRL